MVFQLFFLPALCVLCGLNIVWFSLRSASYALTRAAPLLQVLYELYGEKDMLENNYFILLLGAFIRRSFSVDRPDTDLAKIIEEVEKLSAVESLMFTVKYVLNLEECEESVLKL